MRGISAKSLAEVLAAVDAAQGPASDLGADLFGDVNVLDGNPALRRVLTDPSTEGEAKKGLVRSVLAGKVGSDAVAVAETAVGGRWAAGRDLSDGLETAGVSALVKAAEAAGELDAVESEVFEIGRAVAADAELRGTINDRSYSAASKGELLSTLFASQVGSTSLALAKQAASARTGSFEKVLAAFGDTAAARRQRLLAEVRAAYELGDGERQRLTAALAAKYGRDVHVNLVVDPSVVGGISVSVGGEVVDGTMSSRLEAARRRLAG